MCDSKICLSMQLCKPGQISIHSTKSHTCLVLRRFDWNALSYTVQNSVDWTEMQAQIVSSSADILLAFWNIYLLFCSLRGHQKVSLT